MTETEAGLAEQRGVVTIHTEPELGRDFGVVCRAGALSPAAGAFSELAAARAARIHQDL